MILITTLLYKQPLFYQMPRGRPLTSQIRKNLIEILYFLGKGYGYNIYKTYLAIYPKVTLRSIYHHLRKGADLGEFKIEKIAPEKGSYSWGDQAEKIYYRLGPNAEPTGDIRVKKFLEKDFKTPSDS
ncbi:MAG: hypothetical protein QGH19_00890 [Candidatus Woesearchaeota archaeon]|nr:hypothetical protein [Candidatus Woesearchaeota archaeon]